MCCRLDVGEFLGDFLKHALPQAAGKSHNIRLVGHQDLLALVGTRIFEREADDALHAPARVDVLLGGDLVGGAELEVAAHVRVHPFGVLADDGEVDVVRRGVLQGAKGCVEQPNRTHVSVEIHFEAHAQQDLFGVDVGGHARVAQRADKDGVEVPRQHLKAIRRNGGAVDQIAVGAPVECGELDGRSAGANDFDGVGDNFPADAISGNDRDAFVGGHGERRYHYLRAVSRNQESCTMRPTATSQYSASRTSIRSRMRFGSTSPLGNQRS